MERHLRGGLGDWFQLPSNGGVKGLDWVRASYCTYRYGKIAVAWRCTANGIEVTVPAGTEATIELPGVPSTVQRAGTKTCLARP